MLLEESDVFYTEIKKKIQLSQLFKLADSSQQRFIIN